MLNLKGYLDLLNDTKREEPHLIKKWKGVYYGMSLHIDGACPAFTALRNKRQTVVYPHNYFGVEYQELFEIYLMNKHPRENELTRQWRFSVYKPFSQEVFLQAIQVLTASLFQDSGYSITVDDAEDNEYIWGNNFQGNNLVQYLANKMTNILEDPNGIFVTIPKAPYYKTSTDKIEVDVFFIPSRDIIYLAEDEIIFKQGDFHWAVNNLNYFRFVEGEDGEFEHYDTRKRGYYAHMLYTVPLAIAGGIWNTQGYYDSWFNSAKAIADEYVSNKSAEQLVNKEASHPFIIEASEGCPDCNRTGSVSIPCETCSSGNELIQCDRCGGSGEISHNPGDRLVAPKEDMDRALIQVISPNIAVNTFHEKKNENLKNDLMRSLHLDYIDQAQSGTAKDKDMQTRYQFMMTVANDIFDRLITQLLKNILSLRNVVVKDGITQPYAGNFIVIKPSQFDIKTSTDLLADYNAAKTASMPAYMLGRQLEDYTDKQFGGDDVIKKKVCIINQIDVLSSVPVSSWAALIANGDVESRDTKLSVWLPKILDDIIRVASPEWFISATYDNIYSKVMEAFDKKFPPTEQKQRRS